MKKTLSIIALLAIAAPGCNRLDIVPDDGASVSADGMVTEIIIATEGEDRTKASIREDNGGFTWDAGDKVAMHASNGEYYVTDELGSGGTATSTFSVRYPEGSVRDAFAIFPSSIVSATEVNYGQGSQSLDVMLPDSCSLSQISGSKTPCPMIATNEPGSGWVFKQLCGLLRLTVNAIPEETSYLKMDFHQYVAGMFSIPSPVEPGTSTIAVQNASGNNATVITVTDFPDTPDATYTLNIPLPIGTYDIIDITAYDSNDKALLSSTRRIRSEYDPSYTASRAHGKKLTATLVSFSVSNTKKVIIAPGNLVAKVDNTNPKGRGNGRVFLALKWYFADHQYDFNLDDELDGTHTICDHFGWIGDKNIRARDSYGLYSSASEEDYLTTSLDILAHDWGTNVICLSSASESSYPSDTWRTPGDEKKGKEWEEWEYLLYTRKSTSSVRFVKVTVAGKGGVIIFPDNYSHPSGVNYPNHINDKYGDYVFNEYDEVAWEAFEAAGCVFLPAAGYRTGTDNLFDSTGRRHGEYWLKSLPTKAENAYSFSFDRSSNDALSKTPRNYGCSVRLVRDI